MTTGRRWGAALAFAAVLGGALLALPASSPAAKVPAQFHGASLQRHITDDEADRIRNGGVGVVRFLISWQTTEPVPGVYDWSSTDAYLRSLGPTGAKALPFFGAAPEWLETDSSEDPMSTVESRDSWRDFMQAVLDRYGPDGSFVNAVPEAARVHNWQIWNEPNLNTLWGAEADPDSYARMVEISSDVIRDRDPDAEIMLAGLAPALRSIKPWDFVRRLLAVLDPDVFDTVALHPYAEDQAGVDSQIFRVRAAMATGGAGEMPLAITEFGWGSSRRAASSLAGTPRSQARRLAAAYRTFSRRPGWRIEEALWFSLHDIRNAAPNCGFCSSSGLLRANGDPKLAWTTFKRSVKKREEEPGNEYDPGELRPPGGS